MKKSKAMTPNSDPQMDEIKPTDIDPVQRCFELVENLRIDVATLLGNDPKNVGIVQRLEHDFTLIKNILIYKGGAADPEAATTQQKHYSPITHIRGKEIKVPEKKKATIDGPPPHFDSFKDPNPRAKEEYIKKLIEPGLINSMIKSKFRVYAERYIRKIRGAGADLGDWEYWVQNIISAHYRIKWPDKFSRSINDQLFEAVKLEFPLQIDNLSKITTGLERGLSQRHIEFIIEHL